MNPDNRVRLIIGLQEIVDKRDKEVQDQDIELDDDDLEIAPSPMEAYRKQFKAITKAQNLLLDFVDDREIRDLFEAAVGCYD